MAILKGKRNARSDGDCTLNRVFPVTVKLTKGSGGESLSSQSRRGLHAANGYAM